MKKKIGRRILSFALSLMMVFTALFVGGMEVRADENTVVWKDAALEDIWNSSSAWKCTVTDWDTMQIQTYSYATSSNGADLSNFDSADTAHNFSSSSDNNEILLTQTVSTLPAGTYTLAAPVMGSNAQVTLFYKANGITTEIKTQHWLSGWNTWDNLSGTQFTIPQDLTAVEIGVSILCHNGGWGYLDSIRLTSTDVTILSTDPAADPVYNISVVADKTSVEVDGNIVLTATVTKDGSPISTLPSNYKIGFFPSGTGKTNATYSQASDSFTDTITLKEAGEFYFTAALYDTTDNSSWRTIDEAYITLTGTGTSTAPVYTVEATVDKTSVNQNDTVKLTAVVKKDGVVVPQDQLDEEGLQLWWWADKWQDAHTDGLVDATFANYDENSGYSLTADATLPSAGTYYILAELRETAPSETVKGAWVTETVVKITTQASTSEGTPTSESDDTETEDEEVVNIELVNADFSTSPTGTWTGEVTSGWIEGNSMDVVSYSTDAWLQLPSYVGTTGLKFSMNHGETMTISQWLTELPAGTYTITAPVMGENTDIYLVLGDQEVKATSLSGYNNWSKAKATFTITEDMTDVKVGFKLVAKSSGSNYSWGWIDSISLVKGVPATGDTTNVMGFVALMVTGAALVAYTSVKRRKVNF